VATMRDPEGGSSLQAEAVGPLTVRRLDVTDPSTYDIPDDLRVLVNNAGVDSEYLPVEHANLDDWRVLFETNVVGVVGVTSAAIPALRANHPSVVCNITSSSIIASVPFYSAYRASKAAVSMLTLQYAKAVPEIKFNAVEPGYTATDFTASSGGGRPVEESAKVVVRVATIGPDGPTGTFQEDIGELPW